jgi:PiT family inorganic phosphate transporter
MVLTLLIIVVVLAIAFEYINGFHDTANAIATVVSTNVLSPRKAIVFAAVLNFVGALSGTHVAKTIGSGMVNTEIVTQGVIICALFGAIIWNLITWYFGIPSSSSHALIGGLMGASVAKAHLEAVNVAGVMEKVVIPMFVSPVLGLAFGFLFMLLLLWLFHRTPSDTVNRTFRRGQLVSSAFMAFSHGSNDAQKTMGIITLALFAYGAIPTMDVPMPVVLICALVMCLGTAGGGWRIIHTMGSKVIKLKPIHGFAAETSAAAVIFGASHFGIPISTTHVISTSIMGVGCTQRFSAMKWGIVGTIIQAWIFTIPLCMLIAWSAFRLLSLLGVPGI